MRLADYCCAVLLLSISFCRHAGARNEKGEGEKQEG